MASVYIENLGCAKNQVDAEIMGSRLEDAGWVWTTSPDTADLIIVNTCGFIEPAQQESIDTTLAFLADYSAPVVLAGCMAQRFSAELAEGIPEVAGVFGNREPQRIAEFVAMLSGWSYGAEPQQWLPEGRRDLADPMRRRLLSHPGSAYLKIAEGCDHACSFCAIPSIRGTLRTRRAEDIRTEFRRLREQGVVEFNLIAQDLAAWRDGYDGEAGFPSLLRTLLAEPGEFWLRPLYLYPDTFPDEVITLAAADSRLLPYFDLSFQHASRRILRRMGRPGDASHYHALIRRIRERLPDVALRSSFIVGFPGETPEEVEELRQFIIDAQLEWVGVFEYSAQTGTPAAAMDGQVDPEEMTRRRLRIEEAQQEIVSARLSRFVGRTLPVLLEEAVEGTDLFFGRSPIQAPDVDGLVVLHAVPAGSQPGDIVTAEITEITGVDMQARAVYRSLLQNRRNAS